MCSFAARNATDFNLTMLRFVSTQAGLIEPRPGRTTFNLSGTDVLPVTRAAPGNTQPASSLALRSPGAANAPFNLDACFTMVAALDGHERVVGVRA